MKAKVYERVLATDDQPIEVDAYRFKYISFLSLTVREPTGTETLSIPQAKLLIAMLEDAVAAVEATR